MNLSLVIYLLSYKYLRINPNQSGLYIDSSDWTRNKKDNLNPINKKVNLSFQYTVTVSLDHEEIEKHYKRITKIKPFINKYNWKQMNF